MMPDDGDDLLGARLRALRLTSLPDPLRNRLLAVEPPPVTHRVLVRFLPLAGSLVLTTTILLMIALAVGRHGQPSGRVGETKTFPAQEPSSEERVFVPAERRSTLLGVSEGEVVDAGSERQIRLVRAVWLDDTTYVGADQATVHRRTTRTEVVPVALETL